MDVVLLGTLVLLIGILLAVLVIRATADIIWKRLKLVTRPLSG
jgi:hypothetical protein